MSQNIDDCAKNVGQERKSMNKAEAEEIIKEAEEWLELTRTTNIYARARIVVSDLLKVISERECHE